MPAGLTIPTLLLRLSGVGVALEAVRLREVRPIEHAPEDAVDLADLLGVPRPEGVRYAVSAADGVVFVAGSSARRQDVAEECFHRVPEILASLRKKIGLTAILVEGGQAWLVLRPPSR